MTQMRCAEVLRLCPLFKNMSERTENILLSLPEASCLSGETADGDGGFSPRLGIVLCGRVNIFGRGSGKKVLLNRIEKGNVFGAASVFFEHHENVSTVVAATRAKILFVPRETLSDILENDYNVASEYIKLLSEKIYFLNKRILSFTAKNADSALACFLLERANRGEPLSFPMTRLASALDMGRTTLYRALDALTACGAILCDGKDIKILDKSILEKRADL